jgi:hypothetical protein
LQPQDRSPKTFLQKFYEGEYILRYGRGSLIIYFI